MRCLFCVTVCSYLVAFGRCKPKLCRVLCLSGGADRGSYEAGAIQALTQMLPDNQTGWDVITGVSVGSINTAASRFFDVGEEDAWADFLVEVWRDVQRDRVYKNWPFGPLEGLFFQTALFDTSPLKEFVSSKFKEIGGQTKGERRIAITATDMKGGFSHSWNETLAAEDLVDAVMASSAMPGLFPPHQVNGSVYSDGGILENVNVMGGIKRCLVDGIAERVEDISIDIVTCAPPTPQALTVSQDKTVSVLLRSLVVKDFENSIQSVREALDEYPEAHFRYIVMPREPLVGLELACDQESIQANMKRGFQDAAVELKNTEDAREDPETGKFPFPGPCRRFNETLNEAEKTSRDRKRHARGRGAREEGKPFPSPTSHPSSPSKTLTEIREGSGERIEMEDGGVKGERGGEGARGKELSARLGTAGQAGLPEIPLLSLSQSSLPDSEESRLPRGAGARGVGGAEAQGLLGTERGRREGEVGYEGREAEGFFSAQMESAKKSDEGVGQTDTLLLSA
uniref:PNPLA domain-containing protein n=1 Tax=Chromera velia CCMP2878 TaxID=1169474 RepID=A0A0G4HL83_9ALVE|eukprot:Cvel_28885.t1-p1 / transcript=Cvel_28885.t1 / gene=Cvel_28885 / organism=Chromera_velia_CCMP2878 / gene_product=hypothetical protein / transcript_product=hypothetical protein / location=Cvel_scaffold3862:4542-10681(-) / protein_length=511 / sequence_SO=supercontig / SO=protein_coding / is_pseudo=false